MSFKNFIAVILFFVSSNLAYSQQKVQLISFEQLNKMINKLDSSIYVINFWATWCGPCIKELPALERFYAENTHKNVKLLLVSFDFPNEMKKVKKFIEKKDIKAPVFLIADADQNAFIDKVSEKWQGTIPATWFVNNKNHKKLFIEKPLKYEEIQKYVSEIDQ